jgi:hypothetical protein
LATNPNPRGRSAALAVLEAEQVVEAAGTDDPAFLDILAAAYAEAGRFPDAIAAAERARTVAGQTTLARRIEQRLELYRRQQAFRETLRRPTP